MKNSAKVMLISVSRTDVFPFDVILSKDDVLEARQCNWRICVGNLEHRFVGLNFK